MRNKLDEKMQPPMVDTPIENVEIYRQHYSHFGRMNDLLYKLPPLYGALIGGLWYFAISIYKEEKLLSSLVFFFALISCGCSIIITNRFREAFRKYIDSINNFDREHAISLPDGISSLRAIRFALYAASFFSFVGAIRPFWLPIIQFLNSITDCELIQNFALKLT